MQNLVFFASRFAKMKGVYGMCACATFHRRNARAVEVSEMPRTPLPCSAILPESVLTPHHHARNQGSQQRAHKDISQHVLDSYCYLHEKVFPVFASSEGYHSSREVSRTAKGQPLCPDQIEVSVSHR